MSWLCPLGHQKISTVAQRSKAKECPICLGRNVLEGFNDLATEFPELAAQASGWDPTTVTSGSGKRFLWKCELGHYWTAGVNERARKHMTGCPICAGRNVLAGFNDLATTYPELAAQAKGWDPTTVTKGSHKSVLWICELGHEWSALVKSRVRGNGCLICAGYIVLVGFNDLATKFPELAAQAEGWDPTTVTSGSRKRVLWECELGHQWKAMISLRSYGTGCPTCAPSGYDPNLDGWLYFLDHDELDLYQIGISNFPENRIAQHEKSGWTELGIRGAMDGHLTRNLETAILRSLKKRGAVFANKTDINKFDGWREAWVKSSFDVKSIADLLALVYLDDSTTD